MTVEEPLYSVGIIGVRGYVGREVVRLLAGHANLALAFASSRELAGKPVSALLEGGGDLTIEALSPEEAADRCPDIAILGLPNGLAAPFVEAFNKTSPETLIIDLSADYRFDSQWAYGLPELYREREKLHMAKRISNPGCYATAGQTAIYPVKDLLSHAPSIFAVSGYSGAGTKPSPMNDEARLKDNLIPYKLTDHIHEREMSRQLQQDVHFTPHVHPAFSGLLATVHLAFRDGMTKEKLHEIYAHFYAENHLIKVREEAPALKEGSDFPGILIGGFDVSKDGTHGVIVAVEDNLLKGAAVQAVQNINIALGLGDYTGIDI